jgi:hypothetical protein
MPAGETADEAAVAQISTLYQQLIACLNAGDYLRAYALYSDDYLERNLSDELLDHLQATPVPVEASQQSTFNSVVDARTLDDGRLAALVSTGNPQSGEILLFTILQRQDDRLLIDEEQVIQAAGPAATPPGTPAA